MHPSTFLPVAAGLALAANGQPLLDYGFWSVTFHGLCCTAYDGGGGYRAAHIQAVHSMLPGSNLSCSGGIGEGRKWAQSCEPAAFGFDLSAGPDILTLRQTTEEDGGQTLTLVGSAKMDVRMEPVGHSWVTARLDIKTTAMA